MSRAAAVVFLAAALSMGPRAVHAACTVADLARPAAGRCVQAHVAAVNRCRRAGTPLATCAARVSSPACQSLPAECRPAEHLYSILNAVGPGAQRDGCRRRVARAAFRLLKRSLARGRAGTLSSLAGDDADCIASALNRCDATPTLGTPCGGLTDRGDLAACVCNLALPVLPASVGMLIAGCPSELAGSACGTATGLSEACHEGFTQGGGDDFCLTGNGDRSSYGPPADGDTSRASSFPIRPRARRFHTLYPEVTGAVSATTAAAGPPESIVGASDQGHVRLTAPSLTTRLLLLRWHTDDLPDGATTRLRATAGARLLADVATTGIAGGGDQQVAALVSWTGDLDVTVSALATARRDRSVPTADLAWRLAALDPNTDDDVDGLPNVRDPKPLDRTVPAVLPSTRPRVLLVGLDGAGWDVLGPLIDAGWLPTIGPLVRGGAWAKLDETGNGNDCCYCPPVWSSIATGQPRTVHGMIQLWDEPYERAAPAIWTVLAAYGGTTTQVSYRNTFPAEPGVTYDVSEPGLAVGGAQVFDAVPPLPVDDALDRLELTWPPLLFETLGILPWTGPRTTAWNIFTIDRTGADALARLAATTPTDLTMWILHSIDKSEHLTWQSVQPHAGDPTDVAAVLTQASQWMGPVTGPCCGFSSGFQWGTVASQYLEADQHVARVLAAAHYDYVLFASDHTMTLNASGIGLPGLHTTPPTFEGVFAISGPGIAAGRDLGTLSLLDVAPTLAYLLDLPVADDLPGSVATAAFTDDHLTAHPISHVASWPGR